MHEDKDWLDFVEEVKEQEECWNNEPNITCEFSTSPMKLAEKMLYLHARQRGVNKGHWRVKECGTCRGYDQYKPYHVQLLTSLDWEEAREIENQNYHLEKQMEQYVEKDSLMVPLEVFLGLIDYQGFYTDHPEKDDNWPVATQIFDDHRMEIDDDKV